MADLKLLTERVVEKEKTSIRQSIEEAKNESEDEIQAFEAEEVQRKEQTKDAIKTKSENEYDIKRNTLEIQKRNNILSAKQTVLNKVFVDGKEELNQIDKESFQSFLVNVLERFSSEEDVTLQLGEKSTGLIDSDWLEKNQPEQLTVTLSNDTISEKSGFLIEKEGIEYNFLFDSLVEEIKTDILSEVSNELF